MLLAVLVAGAGREGFLGPLNRRCDDLAAATAELVIGADSAQFWGAIPQPTKEVTVSAGTKLVFQWEEGHDVVRTTEDAWGNCVRHTPGGSNPL